MNVKVLLFSILGAILATTSLVWIMAILVTPKIHESEERRKTIVLQTVDLVEPVIEEKKKPKEKPVEQTLTTQPTPPKLSPPKQAPTQKVAIDDLFDFADPSVSSLGSGDLAINPLNVAPDSLGQTPTFSRSAQYVIRVDPIYPASASRRGVTGFVELGFLIDSNGKAQDIQIIASDPEGVFERESIKSIKKSKFQPDVENGELLNTRVSVKLCFGESACD